MSICAKLAIRSLLKNKGRTLATLLGILLSVLMVCTILTLLNSMLRSMIDFIIERDGSWHIAVYNITEQEAAQFKNLDGVMSVQTILNEEQTVARLALENPDEVYSFADRYLEGRAEYSYHTELLSYLGISQNENIKSLVTGLAAALLIIVGIGAVSLIYNAFAVSVTERTKEIALLSSIGAAKKEIRTIIIFEALILGTLAIPFGIGLGVFASWMLLDGFGSYIGKILYTEIEMRLSLNGWLFLMTAGIAYFLVIISAGIPARSASKISIADHLKDVRNSFKVKHYNDHSSVERLLAARNLKREKNSFRSIAFSLSISIFLFVSAYAFSNYILSFTEAELAKTGYDLRMRYSLELGEEGFAALYAFASSQDGIDEIGWLAENTVRQNALLDSEWVTDGYAASQWADPEENSGMYQIPLSIFIISDERYAEFLDKNELESSSAVYASAYYEETDSEGVGTDHPVLKDGHYQVEARFLSDAASDRLSQDIAERPDGSFDYEDYYDRFYNMQITVGAFDFPFEFRANSGALNVLIPERAVSDFYAEIESKEIIIRSPNYNNIQKNINEYLNGKGLAENVTVFSASESYESQRNLAVLIKLFSSLFFILLSVIACANLFNAMTTGFYLRKREFAVLRSVGMTLASLFKMLCVENLLVGIFAVVIGGAASLPVCLLLYQSVTSGASIPFSFPVGTYAAAAFALLILLLMLSLYGFCKIRKNSILADLRNDFA